VNSNSEEDRRKARRFRVGWDVAVKGTDRTGRGFVEIGVLGDLSSVGAFLYLPKAVPIGAMLELRVKVPFKKNNLVTYTAQVVRVRNLSVDNGVAERLDAIAVKFDTARPVFRDD
jgi:PilZ domain